MSSPPLRGSAEWSARREVVLLLELTGGNRRRAQWLWLQKERTKAEASQLASATSPQARQQPAGCQAKPATARARVVPKPKKSAARLAKDPFETLASARPSGRPCQDRCVLARAHSRGEHTTLCPPRVRAVRRAGPAQISLHKPPSPRCKKAMRRPITAVARQVGAPRGRRRDHRP